MRVPKFKVGDKVRVLRKPTADEIWGDCWMPEMDKTIGQTLTVVYVYGAGHMYTLSPIAFRYPKFVLQSDIKVGQQLLFSFMEK